MIDHELTGAIKRMLQNMENDLSTNYDDPRLINDNTIDLTKGIADINLAELTKIREIVKGLPCPIEVFDATSFV